MYRFSPSSLRRPSAIRAAASFAALDSPIRDGQIQSHRSLRPAPWSGSRFGRAPRGQTSRTRMDANDHEQLPELLVGRVVAVDDHPGARAPSYLLRVALGARGEIETSVEQGSYEREEI